MNLTFCNSRASTAVSSVFLLGCPMLSELLLMYKGVLMVSWVRSLCKQMEVAN